MKKAMLILVCLGVVCSITACGNTDGGGEQTAKNTLPVVKADYEAAPQMAQADNTVDIAKETFSSSEPDEKTDVSSKEKSSSKKSVTENKVTEKKKTKKGPGEQNMEYQALGEKLLKELENKVDSKITFFDNLNGVIAEITDTAEIDILKKSLKIDQWQVTHKALDYEPYRYINFGNDFRVDFEGQTNTESWMAIHTSSDHAWFLVPEDVYNTLFEKYGK